MHAVYDELPDVLRRLGIARVQGVLFDLGVSSLQLDEAERGLRLPARRAARHADGPDDRARPPPMCSTTTPPQDLTRVLRDYGEERFARRIADAIVRERPREPFTTSARLVELLRAAIPAASARSGGHPAKRTFQALRIEVNGELAAWTRALPAAVDALAVGGRIAVLAYHSLEDRLVKQLFAEGSTGSTPPGLPVELPGHAAVPAAAHPRRGGARRRRDRGQPAGRLGPAARRRADPRGESRMSQSLASTAARAARAGGAVGGVPRPGRRAAACRPVARRHGGRRCAWSQAPPTAGSPLGFAMVCAALLGAGLIALLLLNTAVAQDSFGLQRLQAGSQQLADTRQALVQSNDLAAAPAQLSARAWALGLVPASGVAFVQLPSGQVLGVADPAARVKPPTVITSTNRTNGTTVRRRRQPRSRSSGPVRPRRRRAPCPGRGHRTAPGCAPAARPRAAPHHQQDARQAPTTPTTTR